MTDEELVKRLRNENMTEEEFFEVADALCDEAADRIEILTEQLEAAHADAKEAEAYAKELEAKLDDLQDRLDTANKARAHVMGMAVRRQAKLAECLERNALLEARLGKAVEAADGMLDEFCIHETQRQSLAYDNMCATLAEIEGDKK